MGQVLYGEQVLDSVLKLKGIDEFETLRGFKRGMIDDYLEYVEPLVPKDLSKPIKYVQIYDNIKRHDTRDGVGQSGNKKGYAKPCKQNRCFNYNEVGHAKAECPKLKD
ncbi:hypothetical protein GOP47_0020652 [Adiantum capillus-veneris]|uniref:CCHC-type domain-containing protein n=1 Tax=Adiantum capillus-veneris TaxID=13818 RepID=A0A9D4Z7X9_ADICA|nr:hypothetical protein GOP47_0020652 [Adiantum capillus-veneris]